MPSVQGGDVGGVDRVQQVAGGEDAVGGGAQRGVHDRSSVLGVDLDAAQAGQFVVGNPAPGEDHRVAGEGAPSPGVDVLHRLEFIRRKDGVSFYNDSKATNVASVQRSLSAFNAPIILIAGGRDKEQDFSPLVDLVKRRVKNLILIGEAKEKINRIIGDFSETFLVGTFEEAVLLAYQKSRNGDVILLSPACASYDMFKSYEERGDYFKKLVAQL